jgi:hypothetical protein
LDNEDPGNTKTLYMLKMDNNGETEKFGLGEIKRLEAV